MKKFFNKFYIRVIAFVWKTAVELFRGKGLHKVWPFGPLYDWMVSVIRTYHSSESVNVDGFLVYTTQIHRSSLALWRGEGEQPAFRLYETEITEGGTAVDVGANVGYHTLHLARAVGKNGKVFSFEPGPDSVKFINKNLAANNFHNVTVVAKAVGDHSGKADLFLGSNPGGNQIFDARKMISELPNPSEYNLAMLKDREKNKDHEQSISVDLVSLDDFFKDYDKPIDFVKIDVEGVEDVVLAGMENVLHKNPGIKILFEFTPAFYELRGVSPRKLLEALSGSGFVFYDMHNPKNRKRAIKSASIEHLLAACKGNMAIDVFAKR